MRFRGLHAYHGAAQHLRTPGERRAAIDGARSLARETKEAIEAAGIACPVVTGAGTGTWQHERDSGVYTELQPGSYVFMDADYDRNALAADEHHFEQSLYVARDGDEHADARARDRRCGTQGVRVRFGPAAGIRRRRARIREGLRRARRARIASATPPPVIGDRLWLVPGHCDPTVNLYDWIVGLRGTRVECVWPIAARGALA